MANDAQVKPDNDVGLGLSEFLIPSPDQPDGKTEEKVEAPKEEAKGEEDKEPDKKDDEKPDSEETKPPEGAEKKEEAPSPEAAKEEAKPPEEEKPKIDWDSEDNPLKKRLRDTQNWATDLNKKYQDQEREIQILGKKVEGTYDEEKDNPQPTASEIEAKAERSGRAKASREAANSLWSEAVVAKDLDKFYEIFGRDEFMQGSVMSADQPVVEAIHALRRYEFFEEFGYEPEVIIKKISEKAIAEHKETVQKEETQKLADRIKAKDGEAQGLAGLASKSTETPKETSKTPEPLSKVFEL